MVTTNLRRALRRLIPARFLQLRARRKVRQTRAANSRLSLQEVFSGIYANNVWGGGANEFYSGRGSQYDLAKDYSEMVQSFIRSKDVRHIVDVGCGDFRVGALLQMPGVSYTGIDVVPGLIDRNARNFGSDTISFACLDATRDELPNADLVLVRQVFQHLSNAEISRVLKRLEKFPYIIVTEHCPASSCLDRPNIDKPHGGDTRLHDRSGVYLEYPPFAISDVRCISEHHLRPPLVCEDEVLRSVLVTGPEIAESNLRHREQSYLPSTSFGG